MWSFSKKNKKGSSKPATPNIYIPAHDVSHTKLSQFPDLPAVSSHAIPPRSTPNTPLPRPPTKINAQSAPNVYSPDQASLPPMNAYRPQSPPRFVGGFRPRSSPPSSNSLPSSISVPKPNGQSLTMQMALRPENHLVPPPGGSHATLKSEMDSISNNLSSISIASPIRSQDDSGSRRPKYQSAPPLPPLTLQTSPFQCAGITKAGKQCTRKVKPGPALTKLDSHLPPVQLFCFQHTKEVLSPSGYFSRKDGNWVKFDDWIPKYLQLETQVALRVEMERAKSKSDTPGYIYTFEIRDPGAAGVTKLKVGRAVNLVKRIDQWGKQCGSKEQVLRGWYPGIPDSLMKGRVQTGEGPRSWCHRLERLIHIELSDLAATDIYLNPEWPKINARTAQSTLLTKTNVRKNEPCLDCGTVHKEIFEFKRLTGAKEGKEWETIVQPVIERWGTFVDRCV